MSCLIKRMIKLPIRHNFIADYFGTSPPPPLTPGGVTSFEDSENRVTFPVGSRVNCPCPDEYGLDGIPYRVCTKNLDREPHSTIFTIVTVRQFCDSFFAFSTLA